MKGAGRMVYEVARARRRIQMETSIRKARSLLGGSHDNQAQGSWSFDLKQGYGTMTYSNGSQ